MNKKRLVLFLTLLTFISLYLLSINFTFFPSDVLSNTPSFSEEEWIAPRNSLLADPVYQFEPWREYARDSIRSGMFPLWNNLNSHGVPFFANFQSAVLFPLNVIYYIFPQSFALLLIPLIKLLILSIGTYLYLKEIHLKKVVARIGALAVASSGFPLLWLHWPHTNVFILLPLVLLATEKIYNGKGKAYRWFMLTSIIYMTMIFAGHPETLLHVFLLHLTYIICRFWSEKKEYAKFVFSIIAGFFLGAVQIIPFVEYLLNSAVLKSRSESISDFLLPLPSILLNFFPFLLGAPHKEIYRPLSAATNFQETVGGYVGIVVLLTAFYWVIRSRTFYVKFWAGVVIASLFLSYKIWPIYLLSQLPLIRISANHRLVGLAGFGIVIIFCFFLQNILTPKKKEKILLFFPKKLLKVSMLVTTIAFILSYLLPISEWRLENYLSTIRIPLFLVTISSFLYLYFLNKPKKLFPYFLAVIILLQSGFLFYDYNPFTRINKYYPETSITRELEKLPKGTYLEVGNPALPANINLMYDLKNIQNYDAIEINSFKEEFNKSFPQKNNWGNPENIKVTDLTTFKIDYIVSDFNINLTKRVLQANDTHALPELSKNHTLILSFLGNGETIEQLRIKPATFNRTNTCNLNVTLNNSKNINLLKNTIPCKDLRNNMFYVINIKPISLEKGEAYKISFSSSAKNENAVSLFGDSNQRPYIEALYKNSQSNFKLLGETKYYSVYKVLSHKKNTNSKSKLIYEDSTKSVYDIKGNTSKNIIIPRTYYPGWIALVNGEKVQIKSDGVFMSIPLKKGNNLLEIEYKPVSFFVGLIISLGTLLLMIIMFLRFEYQSSGQTRTNLLKSFTRAIKGVTFTETVVGVTIGIVFSIITASVLLPVILPKSSLPFTTAINWITTNNYPKSQDYFNYYTFTLIIFSGGILGFLGCILWKRKR